MLHTSDGAVQDKVVILENVTLTHRNRPKEEHASSPAKLTSCGTQFD